MPKVILISGGSDGLGKAIAKVLSPASQVVILAHNRVKLEAAAKEIGCDFIEAEMTDYDSLQNAVNQVVAKYQNIDVLINNAGIWTEGPLETNEPAKIKEIIDVNTTGTIFLTKAVLIQMKKQKTGHIVNVVSQDGLCAKKDRAVYSASKWAITGFTKCLQEDLSEENIKVTGIYPGLMKTALFQKEQVQRDLSAALDPASVASLVAYAVNLNQAIDIPEIVIKNKTSPTKTMDDNSAPVIDLNIDPDLITPQGVSPQVAPTSQPAAPVTPPVASSGIIDITPGAASDNNPVTPEVTSHLSDISLPEPQPIPDEPAASTIPDALVSPVSETTPAVPAPETVTPPAEITSETLAPIASVVPETPAIPPTPSAPSPLPPQAQNIAPDPSVLNSSPSTPSPIAEDPDLVKLIK